MKYTIKLPWHLRWPFLTFKFSTLLFFMVVNFYLFYHNHKPISLMGGVMPLLAIIFCGMMDYDSRKWYRGW